MYREKKRYLNNCDYIHSNDTKKTHIHTQKHRMNEYNFCWRIPLPLQTKSMELQLDLVLNSEAGGDLSDFITNGEWYLLGEYFLFYCTHFWHHKCQKEPKLSWSMCMSVCLLLYISKFCSKFHQNTTQMFCQIRQIQ